MFRPLRIITKVKDCTLSKATTASLPNLASLAYDSLIILRLTLYIYIYIQGVTEGTDQTSGGCSLC